MFIAGLIIGVLAGAVGMYFVKPFVDKLVTAIGDFIKDMSK